MTRRTDAEVMDLLLGKSALNKARSIFSGAAASIEQAQSISPIEMRRMEFEAVEKIAQAISLMERCDPSRDDLIESIQQAIVMLSEHIEEFHDFDYAPHHVPAELQTIKNVQHHLEGSLISKTGEFATLSSTDLCREDK